MGLHEPVTANDFERRRANRLRTLNTVAELTGFTRVRDVSGQGLLGVLTQQGLTQAEVEDACRYLEAEGLIEGKKSVWNSYIPRDVLLTHHGLKEIELSLSKPDEPTQYFPPALTVVNIHGHNIGSPIQAASPGASQVTSVYGLDLGKVREVVDAYESAAGEIDLPAEEAAALRADMLTVRAQIESPRPDQQTIRRHLLSARTIAENAAGGFAGSAALAGLLELLQHLRF